MNPTVRRIFCPPKEAYDPDLNADFRYGRPLPPLNELVESSKVIALKLPIAADEKLARIMGTLLKQDWQRAVLNRVPVMQEHPERQFRHVVMLIDEYHLLATAGGSRPIGDEKFLNLCRGAKCIPVVAFQSLSSLRDTVPQDTWRTILSAFATTICLRQKDLFTAEIISKMIGRVDTFKEHYALSEGTQDARVSLVTARTTGPRSSMSMSHSYQPHERVPEGTERRDGASPRHGPRAGKQWRRATSADNLLFDPARTKSSCFVLGNPQPAKALNEGRCMSSAAMIQQFSIDRPSTRDQQPGWETILPYIGPLVCYVEDPEVSEIMVNPSGRIFIERSGLLQDTGKYFADAQLEAAVVRIARGLGSDISARQPILETRSSGRIQGGRRDAPLQRGRHHSHDPQVSVHALWH